MLFKGQKPNYHQKRPPRRKIFLFLLAAASTIITVAHRTNHVLAVGESTAHHATVFEPNKQYMSNFLSNVGNVISDDESDSDAFTRLAFKKTPQQRSVTNVLSHRRFSEYSPSFKMFKHASFPHITHLGLARRRFQALPLIHSITTFVQTKPDEVALKDIAYDCEFAGIDGGKLKISVTDKHVSVRCLSQTLSTALCTSIRKSIELDSEGRTKGFLKENEKWADGKEERERIRAEKRARESAETRLLEEMSEERRRKWRRGAGIGKHNYSPSGDRQRSPNNC